MDLVKRSNVKRAFALAVALVALAVALVPSAAFADEQLSAGALQSGAAANTQQVAIATQASASPAYALLRSDGNLWRCTAKGAPVSKYWNGNAGIMNELNRVRTVFVASDVTEVTTDVFAWNRYTFSSGTKNDSRYSVRLSSSYLKNVGTVKFLTNSAGKSACKLIGDNTFSYASNIKKVVNLNKTKVARIGDYAFAQTNITGISFPKTLKKLGQRAFNKCEKLKSLGGLNKTKLSSLGKNAFYSCSKLKSVALPSTCKVVSDYAFEYCSGLKSIKLGSKTTKLGSGVFYNCEKLASITLPATCKKMDNSVFSGCSALRKVVMRSKTVVTHASNARYSMSQFYNTPIAVEGNSAYIYVPKSALAKYRSSDRDYSNPWYNLRTKFRAI